MARKPKTKKQKLVKQLDDVCRAIIRIRDNNQCQKCGKSISGSNSHPSHVIPKGRCVALRWDLINIKLLCMFCHRFWHENPLAAADWFGKRFPVRLVYLNEKILDEFGFVKPRHQIQSHYTISDLEELLLKLQTKLKELKAE